MAELDRVKMTKIGLQVIIHTFSIFCGLGDFLFGQGDSLILTYDEYLENVIDHHPMAKQANLRLQVAKAELLSARGKLDPLLTSGWEEKNFDEKLYYRKYGAKLRFATTLGLDIVGEFENAQGVFLNPENTTNDFGLWNLGIEVDALQGLIVNERRTALKQAEVFQELARNEQQVLLNDLLYNASKAYLEWQKFYHFVEVLSDNIDITASYLENTKASFFNGEKTAMDTLEAFILYQDALSYYQTNQMNLVKAKQQIENFLWYNGAPVLLRDLTTPEAYENPLFESVLTLEDFAVETHPMIKAKESEFENVEIGQRLKREKLKPKLKLKLRPIFNTSENSIAPSYVYSDYKWGFDFSLPLLFRSEKANIAKGEIKLREIQLDLDNKRNELMNDLERSWRQRELLDEQKILLASNVRNYRLLMDGEIEKLNFGESSLFLVNKRQEKYINGRLKLIDTHIKQELEVLKFLYYSNQLIGE